MKRRTRSTALPCLLALLLASACGKNTTSMVSPSDPKDDGSLFQPPAPADAATPSDSAATATDAWELLLPPCGDEKVEVSGEVTPANILLVLDRSGSMDGQKWVDTQTAIDSVLQAFESFIHFGLLLYPKDGGDCIQTPLLDVTFGLEQSQNIVDTMNALGTGGGTPTAGALQAAAQIYMSTPLVGDRYVIVATDGRPNCLIDCNACPDAGCLFNTCDACINEYPCVRDEVMKAVQDLKIMGVPTFVVGIAGSQSAEEVLNSMAILGGTAKSTDPKYYDTTSPDEFTQALTSIFGSVGSCSVQLNKTPGALFLVVKLNGETIERDPAHQNGWDLTNDDILQFYGPACELASAEGADINVTYVCKYADQ